LAYTFYCIIIVKQLTILNKLLNVKIQNQVFIHDTKL
jgi:hypothetical protein